MTTHTQKRACFFGGLLLLVLGVWVLHGFLDLLAWAVVLAISTWPLYKRLLSIVHFHHKETCVGLGLTILIAAVIFMPVGYGLSRLITEGQNLAELLKVADVNGIPCPIWVENLPWIGTSAKAIWIKELGSATAANNAFHLIDSGSVLYFTKDTANQLVQHFFGFLIILLTLLFVYRNGHKLGQQILESSQKLFGNKGYRYTLHATAAVRSTVNGMLIVGLGKGLLMGVGYSIVSLENPAILGAITGIFALIPFAAKIIFSVCAIVLIAQGHPIEAASLFSYGMILTMVADNYVRPALIGGAVKLPFLWTLLGIFGGMEAFGMLGLFLGPALMALLMSIWRDWLHDLKTA